MNVIYVTGNANKAKYFSEILGMEIDHAPVDVAEIQSLDLVEVVTEKVKAAYAQLQRPVLVEDTSLVIGALGRLPGPLVKWFLEELKSEGLCRLADADPERRAFAVAAFAYYDGMEVTVFEGGLAGTVAKEPRGSSDFGWNPVFIPEGQAKTLGEMDEETFKSFYTKIKPFEALREFLETLSLIT